MIIGREIAVSALREWMAEIGARGRIKVSIWGKYKTIMQIVGLSMLLFRRDLFGIPIYKLGLVLTGVAAVLTLWSMMLYLRRRGRNCGAAQGSRSLGHASGALLLDSGRQGPTIARLFQGGNSSVGRAQPCQG